MRQLSVGMPSTLGSYLKLCKLTFGDKSPATMYIQSKIREFSEEEEVIQDETQMLFLLATIHADDQNNHVKTPNY